MIYGLVALTQAGLLVLLVALVWRMLVLARSEPLLTRPEPLVAGAGHQSVQVARTENQCYGNRSVKPPRIVQSCLPTCTSLQGFRSGIAG